MKVTQAFQERGWPDPAALAPPPEQDHVAALVKYGLPMATAHEAMKLLTEREVAKLELLAGETMDILAHDVEGAPVQNDNEEAALVALVGRSYKVEKEAEAMRLARVAPLNAEVKAVNELVKRAFGYLLSRMGKASDAERRIAAYRRAKAARIQREKDEADRRMREAAEAEARALAEADATNDREARQQAMARAEEASREQMAAELAQPREMTKGTRTEDGKVGFSEVWDFEVIDAALVPRSFCAPDEKAIRAAVRGGVRAIQGVNVFQRESMRRGV
jgi:hypothetical protein